jgi:predicted N-acetyltransferase YhbS
MIIRKLTPQDAQKTSDLIRRVFNEFVSAGWSEKAIQDVLSEQSAEKIIERSKDRDQFVAVTPDNTIIGVVEGKNNSRITRLFVDTGYQRKGIATELMKNIERVFVGRGSKKIIIHSSLHAQKFYEKMEYRKSTKLIRSKGMVYQPMIKYL